MVGTGVLRSHSITVGSFSLKDPPNLSPGREMSLQEAGASCPHGCPLLMGAKGLVLEARDLQKDQS